MDGLKLVDYLAFLLDLSKYSMRSPVWISAITFSKL